MIQNLIPPQETKSIQEILGAKEYLPTTFGGYILP